MSSLHKMKLWFGLEAPGEHDEYDEYAPEYTPEHAREGSGHGADGYERAGYEGVHEGERGGRGRAVGEPAVAARATHDRGFDTTPAARMEPLRPQARRATVGSGSGGAVRGALALDDAPPVRRAQASANPFADDGRHPLATITTLHPRTYNEARTIGERYREGNPVIMNLTEMSDSDAKRLVDFAAGLAFAMRGAIDKVTNKVFLLSPSDVDVSAEDRRRLAETGFFQ